MKKNVTSSEQGYLKSPSVGKPGDTLRILSQAYTDTLPEINAHMLSDSAYDRLIYVLNKTEADYPKDTWPVWSH